MQNADSAVFAADIDTSTSNDVASVIGECCYHGDGCHTPLAVGMLSRAVVDIGLEGRLAVSTKNVLASSKLNRAVTKLLAELIIYTAPYIIN